MKLRTILYSSSMLLSLPVLGACSKDDKPGAAQTTAYETSQQADNTNRATNTGNNARDRNGSNALPTDQGENALDLGITQAIRKSIVADESLSTDAKNVKIITMGGVVTLRGPVRTAEEKALIESKAHANGVSRVDNQLEVQTK